MIEPDYKNYSMIELNEALVGINPELYPERTKALKKEIQFRREAGFIMSAELPGTLERSKNISLNDIALPIWWSFFWRSTLGYAVFNIIIFVLLTLISGLIPLLTEYSIPLLASLQVIAIPIIGIFFMRQVLVGKYSNFVIEVSPKMANKTLQPTAEATSEL